MQVAQQGILPWLCAIRRESFTPASGLYLRRNQRHRYFFSKPIVVKLQGYKVENRPTAALFSGPRIPADHR